MDLCEGCGAEVVTLTDGRPYERLMRVAAGELEPVAHLCRDYLAWHRPADRRDVSTLDVAGGWRPTPRLRLVWAA